MDVCRFEIRNEKIDVDFYPVIAGLLARRGTVAVRGNGDLVVACRDRIAVRRTSDELASLPAQAPLGVALSPDETRVAWIEASGTVHTAAIPGG